MSFNTLHGGTHSFPRTKRISSPQRNKEHFSPVLFDSNRFLFIFRKVDAFDFDVDSGEVKNRRTVIDVQSFEPFAHVSLETGFYFNHS